ncbi:nitroreductase/quinone reductase family protein [Actinotalea sp. Marseille-Q4924]|uniref:nitroreductase/quinone reductase family protein n=1 Tax=Actinotalea sp. Marseille-Q4924 TaxID=2866571 RepID=UPI001CE3CBDF|nr:nitroreductase/quinone reductase family protein [Actinotalea sp. Marseille-Q4924]
MRTTAAPTPARTEEMAVIHRVFRRGLPMVAGLVRRTPPGATGRSEVIAGHLDFLLSALHHHHSGEDRNIWPLLLERAAPAAELVRRMEAQHATVAERSGRVRSLLDAWRGSATDGEPLAVAIDELSAALGEHLDDEEAHVVPLIRAHITAPEWERFGRQTFEELTDPEKLTATGALEDVATAEEAAWFTGGRPVATTVMWRLVGRRRYDRYIAGVRGTSSPGPALQRLFRGANRLAVALYRRSGGRIGGSAKGVPVLLLTAPGRRTGTPHTVPVAYLEHEGGYVVTGSAGGAPVDPQWFRNVRAAHWVRIEIGTESYDAEVTVPDAPTRDLLWRDVVLARAPFFAKYEEKSGRIIPVAVLTPRPPVPGSRGPG